MGINADIETLVAHRFSCGGNDCVSCVLHTNESYNGSMCIANILSGVYLYRNKDTTTPILTPEQYLMELEFCIDINTQNGITCNNDGEYCEDCKIRDFGCISELEKFLCKHSEYWRKI